MILRESFGAIQPAQPEQPSSQNLEEIERTHILSVIEECGWKIKGKANAADRLGLHPSTLHTRMKKLGIVRPKENRKGDRNHALQITIIAALSGIRERAAFLPHP